MDLYTEPCTCIRCLTTSDLLELCNQNAGEESLPSKGFIIASLAIVAQAPLVAVVELAPILYLVSRLAQIYATYLLPEGDDHCLYSLP